MKVSEIIEFKNKKIKKLNLEKELTEQVCDWILEILYNVKPTVSSKLEFKEEDICIDKTGYFTVKVDGCPMGFEVRKLQDDNFIEVAGKRNWKRYMKYSNLEYSLYKLN